jgi:hypothetical protein
MMLSFLSSLSVSESRGGQETSSMTMTVPSPLSHTSTGDSVTEAL